MFIAHSRHRKADQLNGTMKHKRINIESSIYPIDAL